MNKELNDEDLISYTYDIAGQHLRKRINNWNNLGHWRKTVFELPEHVQITYMIGILNMQVMNGGFIQYYDNNYGIFAQETLIGLKTIKAELTYDLLKQSINILKKFNDPETELVNFIIEKRYPGFFYVWN